MALCIGYDLIVVVSALILPRIKHSVLNNAHKFMLQFYNPAEHVMKMIFVTSDVASRANLDVVVAHYLNSPLYAHQLQQIEVELLMLWRYCYAINNKHYLIISCGGRRNTRTRTHIIVESVL